MRRAVLAGVAALAAGCRNPFAGYRPPRPDSRPLDREIADAERAYWDEQNERLRSESELLILTDRSSVRHGRQLEVYEGGHPKSERFFTRGEPSGTWRTWYPDGAPRSQSSFDPAEQPAEMTWWHENGQVSSRGPARFGRREGHWLTWHDNGQLAAEGDYAANRRVGEWTFWREDGTLAERGLYANGIRVGRWERWREDGRPEGELPESGDGGQDP